MKTAEEILRENIVCNDCDDNEYDNGHFAYYHGEVLNAMKDYAKTVAEQALKDAIEALKMEKYVQAGNLQQKIYNSAMDEAIEILQKIQSNP